MIKKILLTILGLVVVCVLAVLAIAATKPKVFQVERSATIAAPPASVFAVINDFHQFQKWSPWEKLDPNMNRDIGGPDAGVGATYYWKGNQDAGEGRMTITESVPDSKVAMSLEFIAPFPANNHVEFNLAPAAEATNVRWSMSGDCPYMMKVMMVFMDMDAAVGKDFEEGLANLGRVAQEQTPMPADTTSAQPGAGS
jgi:uncharacterized protein YndB with AHSA1/START domain